MKQKLEKWQSWIETICKEREHLANAQQIFIETVKILLANKKLPKENIFWNFFEEWYIHSAVMGLRRQLKVDNDSVSLAGLLRDIESASCLLSRKRFVNLPSQDGRGEEQPNAVFDKYAGKEAEFIDSQSVKADLEKFKIIAAKCEEYADRLVAHRDKRGVSCLPTHQELDEAFACMDKLLKKYSLLICGDTPRTLTPVIQSNWKVIFKQPWIQGS